MIIRIISGIIGILVAAVVIQLGGAVFAIFAALLSLIGWHEYSNAMGKKGISTTYIIGALMLVLMLGCAWIGNIAELVAVLTIGTLLIFLMTVIFYGNIRPTDACASAAGVLYIGLPLAHLILLRFISPEQLSNQLNNLNSITSIDSSLVGVNIGEALNTLTSLNFDVGSALIWTLFICTWSSDTFAYFVGTAIGSHKLASAISPKKTIEGFIGSIVGTTAMAILIGHVLFSFPLVEMAVIGFLMSIFATLGDLVESVIKRFVGIKDSGMMLPGHGGMLDRFDSIFYTAPIFYYCVIIFGLI
ncbi:MAG: phosphatidate cytidylyltransferase [Selenomonadaceae bacterium]|nr:phosphatidate cytidylyltransferase [Selenomonadaceae bacterium]